MDRIPSNEGGDTGSNPVRAPFCPIKIVVLADNSSNKGEIISALNLVQLASHECLSLGASNCTGIVCFTNVYKIISKIN